MYLKKNIKIKYKQKVLNYIIKIKQNQKLTIFSNLIFFKQLNLEKTKLILNIIFFIQEKIKI